jgi:hypothetical protein
MEKLLLGKVLRKAAKLAVVFALLGVSSGKLAAQELQQAARVSRNIASIVGLSQEDAGKCGTSAMLYALSHMSQLTADQQLKVAQAMQRIERQKNRLSPSGRFRIHYDTTGFDAPALVSPGSNPQRIPNTYEQFVDSVGLFFDNAWKLEIDTLGYPQPPSDGTAGGGPECDVYIENLGSGYYGFTDKDVLLQDGTRQRFTSYISIHNDFLGFYSPGMSGLRVTAAHEFHHMIQLGIYGIWQNQPDFDRWFLELTSVWMERNAYPQIHDHYQYLANYLQRFKDGFNRSYQFNDPHFGGYERCLWAFFLEKRFGKNVMKDIWEGVKNAPVLTSMSSVLPIYGTTLESEFALFNAWNYYTADRADPIRYYDDGKNYPRLSPNVSTTFGGLTASVSGAAYPFSFQAYQIALTSDTLTAMIANVNVGGALDPTSASKTIRLNLSATDLQPPYQKVARGLGLTFSADTMSQWRTLYLLSSTRSNANTAPDVSPNPLRLSQDSKLVLPVQGATQGQAEVFVLNSALELLYSRQYPVKQSFGNSYIDLPTADVRGAVPTGIYFVVAKCGDNEYKWKVAIIQ